MHPSVSLLADDCQLQLGRLESLVVDYGQKVRYFTLFSPSTEHTPLADVSDLWRDDFPEPAPKTSNAFAAGMVDKHTASKLRQVKCANTKWIANLFSPFAMQ